MNNLKESRQKVTLKEHFVVNTSENDYPGSMCGYDDIWNIKKFKKNFKLQVVRLDNDEMEFDMIGVHAAIANAFRRILLQEVPTMAIEKVFIYNNTSIIPDEVLAHRIGLIPLRADPRLFEYRQECVEGEEEAEPAEQDTLAFELKVKCCWKNASVKGSIYDKDAMVNRQVYSKQLKWVPIGNQGSLYEAGDVGPIHPDILIAKLNPGHEIDMKLLAVKSIGQDHAKFSPVATAFYRLLPEITLLREVEGEQAERLKKCFSPGVIGLKEGKNGKKTAYVIDARYDTCSRNVYRHDDLKDAVKMDKIRNHFIFSIESVGALPPDVLFVEAIRVLKRKAQQHLEQIK